MLNLRPFEIVLISIFAIFAFGGLIFFATYKPDQDPADKPYGNSVIVWGTFDTTAVTQALSEAQDIDKNLQVVRYEQKDPRTFQGELQTALAEGNPPDLVMLPHTLIVKNRKVLIPIPYSSYPERDFRDAYVDGAGIFAFQEGIYGIPFAVDPLVMYWNRNLFSNVGLPTPPRTWESLVSETTPALVRRNAQYELTQRAVAFGEYANIASAKEILSMLLFQAGSTIVEERAEKYTITLNAQIAHGIPPGEAVLSFYTQFVSPSASMYSWNRSQPLDRDLFLGGTLALYFGLGSEYQSLLRSNPNLFFDVAPVPQGSAATIYRNYGTFYAFAIPRSALNRDGAYRVAYTLASATYAESIARNLKLAPVRRDVLGNRPADPIRAVLYQMALISRGWLDPDTRESADVFKMLVEDITSGRLRTSEAISTASDRLRLLFR